ncbi:hypothetical protein ABLE68_16925 [Nocardioides sp. CN2-186]|uniref:hypothetical protein n=1 Tax=Nocardioides tweenelious TaxID=3156607 RepID=UPI0032B4F676
MNKQDGDRHLIIGLALVGLGLLGLALAIGWWLDAKPGSLADWLAAVATLSALLAATYAAIQTSRSYRLERDRDRKRDEENLRQQAAQVAVWPTSRPMWRGPLVTVEMPAHGPNVITQAPGPMFPETIPVTIGNASSLPVFNVAIDVYIPDRESDGFVRLARAHPEQGRVARGEVEIENIVTPELVEQMIAVLEKDPPPEPTEGGFAPTISLGWSFRDVAGVRWIRVPGKELEPVED